MLGDTAVGDLAPIPVGPRIQLINGLHRIFDSGAISGLLLELLLFLLGLGPEAELVGFGLEGLTVGAHRRNAARGARARQEGRDDQPRAGAIGDVP